MSDRDELATLIRDTVHTGARRVTWEDIADAILAAGWVKPGPPCAHRFVIFGGQCGECGQMATLTLSASAGRPTT